MKIKHGFAGSPTYNSWQAMKSRCDYPSQAKYHNYGGKGITYCPEWATFEGFLADMGERPEGRTLDRKDSKGNYNKGNCRWATRWEQDTNKGPKSSNLSSKTGVCWKKQIKRWVARIQVNGGTVYLGCFKEEDDAILARVEAEERYWRNVQ